MFDIFRQELVWGGRTLTLETGKVARQSDGAVMVTYGETVVLCTAVAAKAPKPDIDFFPLTVNYIEKTYAAGKIPGGFFKREARPSEFETLTSRLIDRPIRPLFHPEFKNETQVVCTVLAYDGVNCPDIPAMVGASAALTISGIPFMGPIAGARVGFIDGEYVLNPVAGVVEQSRLELVVAGTKDSVLMVESEADQLTEEEMLGAVVFGQQQMAPVIDAIIALAEDCAKEPWDVAVDPLKAELKPRVKELAGEALKKAYKITNKQERVAAVAAAKDLAVSQLVAEEGYSKVLVGSLLKSLESDIVRGDILKSGKRIDGRDTRTVRPIIAEVDVLPRTHGSALFTRGETQALVVTTLGTGKDEQIIDNMQGERKDSFMLHYNFPPYSVGEASPMRAPGRREIGHGNLARRAINGVLPKKEEFPYTVRVVSEITESNGSSSMATVCGTSLSLMAAGVPISAPVSGIAMGLILEDEGYAILSDIMGDEDHLGDMDFKVAGTAKGITSLQMDIKVPGITEAIMKDALEQAHEGRIHILGEMAKALTEARAEVNAYAPKMVCLTIPVDKIREVIGSGGKVITEICEKTGAKIDIEQDGTVRVAAENSANAKAAERWIRDIVEDPEIGHIYEGVVDGVVEFGAFVKFCAGRSGLVHVSELDDKRVEKVEEYLTVGQTVKVKLIGLDRGKYKLSYKAVDQETGEDLRPGELAEVRPERKERRDRDGDDRRERGGKERRERRDDSTSEGDAGEGGEKKQRRRRPF